MVLPTMSRSNTSASPSASPSPSPLSASIPSLHRRLHLDAAKSAGSQRCPGEERPGRSVNELLARARLETPRRLRHGHGHLRDQDRGGKERVGTGTGIGIPATSLASCSTSASSRAGLTYLTASSLREEETKLAQQDAGLRRRVAGPVPPSSWQVEFIPSSSAGGSGSQSRKEKAKERQGVHLSQGIQEDTVKVALRQSLRLQAWSSLHPLEPDFPLDRSKRSLRDICLLLLFDLLSTSSGSSHYADENTRLEISEDVGWLPLHLKERMVQIVSRGREGRGGLNDRAVERLFFSSAEGKGGEESADQMNDPGPEVLIGTPEGEREWDVQSIDSPDDLPCSSHASQEEQPHRWSTLELSYAQLSLPTLRKLLLGPTSSFQNINVNLRSLNLATDSSPSSPSSASPPSSSLPITKSTIKYLTRLPNLEELSLAGHTLVFKTTRDDDDDDDDVVVVSSTIRGRDPLPWSSLWKSCRKLRVLDLSYCSGLGHGGGAGGAGGLVGSIVTETSHATEGGKQEVTILPQLDQLLLRGSDVDLSWFVSETSSEQGGRGSSLPAFLTPSHARYWGRVRTEGLREKSVRGGEGTTGSPEVPFSEEEVKSVGAPSLRHMTCLARLMDTFRGRMSGGKGRWCEIWV